MGVHHFLDLGQLFQQRSHLLLPYFPQPVADLGHAGLLFQQPGKGRAQHVADGHAGLQHGVLIQITCPDVFGPLDLALVRLQPVGDHTHKGGLALAVGTDEADVLAPQQAEGYVLENGPVTETMGQMLNI